MKSFNIISVNAKRVIIIITALTLAFNLSSCSEKKTIKEFMSSAESYNQKHNHAAAIIELKSAVRIKPKNSQLRIALGESYLASGNYLFADKELNKAIELGVEIKQISNSLAKLYSRLSYVEKSYDLVNQGSSFSDQDYLTLILYAAITALNNEEKSRAHDFLEQAMVFDEGLSQVKVAKAYYNYSIKKYDQGLDVLKTLVNDEDFYFEAVLIQGHLLFAKGNYTEASEKFLEFRNETKQDNRITLFVINSLLFAKNYNKAENYVDEYLKRNENSSTALFYKAKIEFHKENYSEAQSIAQKAFQINSKLYVARGIIGISAYYLEKYEQSYEHLTALAQYLPENKSMNSILALIKFKLGKTPEDGIIFEPSSNEIQLLIDASTEFFKLGHTKEADFLLGDKDIIDESTSEQLLSMGFLKLSLANEDGFEYLKKAIEKKPSSQQARMALVMAYFKSGQTEEALTLAKQWQIEYPKNVSTYNIIAKIKLSIKDIEGAESQLKQSLQLNAKNIYALLYFADKKVDENQFDEAQIDLKAILSDSPENVKALGINFKMALKQNDTVNALAKIETLYLKDSNNHLLKYFFANTLYLNKNYERSIEILRSWDRNNINMPRNYFVLLVGSYSNLQQYNEALIANNFWLEKRPKDNVAWFSKLTTLDKLNDLPQALDTVEEMLARFSNIPRLKVLLPHYQILNKRFEEARKSIEAIEVNDENKIFVQGLLGQILFYEADYQSALPKLVQQYEAMPHYRNAGYLYTSMLKLEKKNDALIFMQEHLNKFPDDIVTKAFYGQTLLHYDLNKAQKIYQDLIKALPDNVVFLNNLSWVEYSLNHFLIAQQYAEKALELSPKQATILDTLSMIYFKQGKQEQAEKASAQAISLAPNDKDITQNYDLIRVQ